MCTDGLSDLIEPSEMRDVVLEARDLQGGCMNLVDLANQRGGHDNITVALIRSV
jgi:serine/threonine protein phosphatase PrpC